MKRKPIVVRIVVDRRAAAVILAAVAVGGLALRLSSETLTMSTTYPAPVGVYNQIITTGNSGTVPADTTLARNAGNVLLAPPGNAAGRVGVGTGAPQAKLDVGGTLRVGAFADDPGGGADGTIYYNSAKKTLRVTQVASVAGRLADQRQTLIGLGLNKVRRSRKLEDTAAVRGMINKVRHLVRVELVHRVGLAVVEPEVARPVHLELAVAGRAQRLAKRE